MFKCKKCGSNLILVESMVEEDITRQDYECPICGLDYVASEYEAEVEVSASQENIPL